jgi:branched-chain amino acid transport system ATP-binding protein
MLELRDLRVRYGAIEAVKGISISVGEREIVTLVGANGAGKSTTLRAISGLLPSAGGSISFRGERIDGLRAHRVAQLGIGHAPEGRRVFARLTVRENLEMGAYARGEASLDEDFDRVHALFPILKERERQAAGTLSGGQQQMLAIGRALMGRPKLLMLDEPSMGLAPIIVDRIFDTIRAINEQGMTVLLVEQNAQMALSLAGRGYVLESGEIVLADAGEALLGNPQVRRAYLGEE